MKRRRRKTPIVIRIPVPPKGGPMRPDKGRGSYNRKPKHRRKY